MKLHNNQNKGVSILEIVIAFGILVFVFTPTIELLYSFNMERLRLIPDFSFDSTQASNKSLSWIPGGSEAIISSLGGAWKPVPVSSLRSQGLSCIDLNTEHLGDKNRVIRVFEYSSAELGLSSTSAATGVGVIGKKLFISANSSTTTDPDILAFEILDRDQSSQDSRPILTRLEQKDTGPGLNSLTVRGMRIFSGNTSVNGQAQVLDARDFNQAMSLKIPGSNSTTSPLTKVVRIYDDLLFVGTEKSILPEIAIFRLSDGELLGQIETGYGINDMLALGGVLFVAGPKDPEIDVFDISEVASQPPSGPPHIPIPPDKFRKVAEYDAPGGSGNGKTFYLNGDSLYLGRTKGRNELLKLNIGYIDGKNLVERPDDGMQSLYFAHPADLGLSVSTSTALSMTEGLSVKIGWSIDAIISSTPYLFIFSADAYKELQMFEEKPSLLTGILGGQTAELKISVDLPGRASSVACRGNIIYVTTQQKDIPLLVIKL